MKLYLLFVLCSLCCTLQASSSDSLGSPLAGNPRHISWKERLAYYLCCCGCCKKQDRPEEDGEDDDLDVRRGIHDDARRSSRDLAEQQKRKALEGFWI